MVEAPSQTQDKFIIRLPNGLRERIKVKADENGRSMNAEIVQVLEREYPEPADVMHLNIDNIRRALEMYEQTSDPRHRIYLQAMVEMMVKAGTNLNFDEQVPTKRSDS